MQVTYYSARARTHVRGLATNNSMAIAPFLVEPLKYTHEVALVCLMQTSNSITIVIYDWMPGPATMLTGGTGGYIPGFEAW